MKLKEIMESVFGRGIDRSIARDWRDQLTSQHASRDTTATGTSATRGIWLISREGKRLAGPFASAEKANQYKAGRPDRIPANAVVKEL